MLEKLSKFKIISAAFLVSAALVLGGLFWTYFTLRNVSGPLILHFNNLVGINQIGDLRDLVWVGITGLLIVVLNFFIALELEARDWFLGKLLAAATVLISILLFIGFAAIISVN